MSLTDPFDIEIRDAIEDAPELIYPAVGEWVEHDGGQQPIPDDQPIQYRSDGHPYGWCAYSDCAPWDRITSFMVEEWTGDLAFLAHSERKAA